MRLIIIEEHSDSDPPRDIHLTNEGTEGRLVIQYGSWDFPLTPEQEALLNAVLADRWLRSGHQTPTEETRALLAEMPDPETSL